MKRYTCGMIVHLLVAVCGLALHGLAFGPIARADSPDVISSFLVRVELTKWPTAMRKPPARIERNGDGQVVLLRLDGMQFETGDVETIRSFQHLVRLSLNSTTITDDDIKTLAALPNLEGLSLNRTAIGDAGVESLAKFPKLKSLCLGGVNVSPVSIRRLKAERPRMVNRIAH